MLKRKVKRKIRERLKITKSIFQSQGEIRFKLFQENIYFMVPEIDCSSKIYQKYPLRIDCDKL